MEATKELLEFTEKESQCVNSSWVYIQYFLILLEKIPTQFDSMYDSNMNSVLFVYQKLQHSDMSYYLLYIPFEGIDSDDFSAKPNLAKLPSLESQSF